MASVNRVYVARLARMLVLGPMGENFGRIRDVNVASDGSIWLRGEWWSLVQIVLVLVFRYATSIVSAMAPALNADVTWHLGTVFTSALLSALFLGRTAARLRVYFSPSRQIGVHLGKDELPVG